MKTDMTPAERLELSSELSVLLRESYLDPEYWIKSPAASFRLLNVMRAHHHTTVSFSKVVKVCQRVRWLPRLRRTELIYAEDPDPAIAIALAARAWLRTLTTDKARAIVEAAL